MLLVLCPARSHTAASKVLLPAGSPRTYRLSVNDVKQFWYDTVCQETNASPSLVIRHGRLLNQLHGHKIVKASEIVSGDVAPRISTVAEITQCRSCEQGLVQSQ